MGQELRPQKARGRPPIPRITGLSSAQKVLFSALYAGYSSIHQLVGGLEHLDYMFPQYIGNVIIPTDEFHHFSEG